MREQVKQLATDREMQREQERERECHWALPTIWYMEFMECDASVQTISLFLSLPLPLFLSLSPSTSLCYVLCFLTAINVTFDQSTQNKNVNTKQRNKAQQVAV